MTRAEEKVKLAEELGLNGFIEEHRADLKRRQEKEEREAVIQELTGMKFKQIDDKGIAAHFPSFKFQWIRFYPASVVGQVTGLIIGSIVAFINIAESGLTPVTVFIFTFAGGIIGYFCGFEIRRIEVDSMPISDWKEEIPYGAMLAMKEAKEIGVVGDQIKHDKWKTVDLGPVGYNSMWPNIRIENGRMVHDVLDEEKCTRDLTIHYPRLAERRLNADPVITGLYKGVRVEIFAWDPRKIYE